MSVQASFSLPRFPTISLSSQSQLLLWLPRPSSTSTQAGGPAFEVFDISTTEGGPSLRSLQGWGHRPVHHGILVWNYGPYCPPFHTIARKDIAPLPESHASKTTATTRAYLPVINPCVFHNLTVMTEPSPQIRHDVMFLPEHS